MSINCDLVDLRGFISVMELGNFHRAAEKLAISQPALTRRIQKLEESIGSRLFVRTTRHVEPTAVARELLPLIRRMIDELDQSIFSVHELGLARSALITMTCIPTAAFYFLPSVIGRFMSEFPKIRFRIMDLGANEGLNAVARGEVEFGINFVGSSLPELDFTPLREDPFVLAAHRDHVLSRKAQVSWADLAGHALITVGRASGNRTLLDSALAATDLGLEWTFETQHLSSALGLVESGLGVAALPVTATPIGEHPIIVTRPLVCPRVTRTIGIVKRRGISLSPIAQRFVDLLVAEWQDANLR